jgi:hypothetical protein
MCYSNSTLIRPPLLQWKSGLIIWEESLGGEGLVVVFIIYEHLKSGPIRWVAFGRSDLIREGLLYIVQPILKTLLPSLNILPWFPVINNIVP